MPCAEQTNSQEDSPLPQTYNLGIKRMEQLDEKDVLVKK